MMKNVGVGESGDHQRLRGGGAAFFKQLRSESGWFLMHGALLLSVFLLYRVLHYLNFEFFYWGLFKNFRVLKKMLGIQYVQLHDPFQSWSIFWGALNCTPYLISFILCVCLFGICHLSLREHGRHWLLRLVTGALAGFVVWYYSTLDFNYFYNSAFMFDRTLMVILLVGVCFWPALIFLLLPMLLAYMGQFEAPLQGDSLTDKLLVFNVLYVVQAWMIVHAVVIFARQRSLILGKSRIDKINCDVLGLAILLTVSASYFVPFKTKLSIGPTYFTWVFEEMQHMEVPRYFMWGWLQSFKYDFVLNIAEFVKRFEPFLMAGVLVTEGWTIFILANRKVAIAILSSLVGLHIGIFVLSGIFFWKWIAVDLLLMAVFLLARSRVGNLFGWRPLFLSIPFFLMASQLVATPPLGWMSTRVFHNFTLEVIDKAGKRHSINPNDMNPYHMDFTFAFQNFFRMVDGRYLPWHTRDYDLLKKINDSPSQELDSIRQSFGVNRFSPEWREQFRLFISKSFRNMAQRGHKGCPPFTWLQGPPHILKDLESTYRIGSPIDKFNVYLETYYFTSAREYTSHRSEVISVDLEHKQASSDH